MLYYLEEKGGARNNSETSLTHGSGGHGGKHPGLVSAYHLLQVNKFIPIRRNFSAGGYIYPIF